MRASSAVLTDTSVRLWDLVFPCTVPLLARTRFAYIHLDNLIAYSKRDRDGKVDAYLACYRPDETVMLFFLDGDLVNAAVFTPAGRFAIAISEALRHIKAEPERSELVFSAVPEEQLAIMYATCTQAPVDLGIDASTPATVFGNILERKFTGVLELISKGFVNYVTVKDGHFAGAWYADPHPGERPQDTMARIFTAPPPEPRPKVVVKAFPGLPAMPLQATPALVKVFREFVWDLSDLAEKECPGDGTKRAEKVRARLVPAHDVLRSVGGSRAAQVADPIVEPRQLADAVAGWTKDFLTELEVIHPSIAPRLLHEAAREPRYALAAVGFFDRLPWRIEW